MKKLAVTVALACTLLAVANRDVDIYRLENIQALDSVEHLDGTKAAFAWVNENALAHLPVAATLRAEELVAGIAIRLAR